MKNFSQSFGIAARFHYFYQMEKFNSLNVYRYEDSVESVSSAPGPVIFLAGPTVRGNQQHLTSWRKEAVELFRLQEFIGSIILPEFSSTAESDENKDWIPLWEFNGLKRADAILFWIPRTRELIGLTTNWELGYWIGRDHDRVIYGRPDDAYRIKYLDIMWEEIIGDDNKIQNTLHSTVKDSIKKAEEKFYLSEHTKHL